LEVDPGFLGNPCKGEPNKQLRRDKEEEVRKNGKGEVTPILSRTRICLKSPVNPEWSLEALWVPFRGNSGDIKPL